MRTIDPLYSYGQGLTDSRVNEGALVASSSMPRHGKQFARLYHPFESWCPKLEDDNKYFLVRFFEKTRIVAIVTQPHPLEKKYVTNAKIEAYVDDWEVVRDENNRNFFVFGQGTRYNSFKKEHLASKVRISPFAWHDEPCLRLEILGRQCHNHFSWSTTFLENSTNVQHAADEQQSTDAVHIPKPSSIKLHGFNILCLAKPELCYGNFVLKFSLSFTSDTEDGIIFSTSGFNTTVPGTSVFLKDSNIIASVRTKSRVWKVSGPVNMTDNAFQIIKINWRYFENIELTIDENTYIEPYSTVSHLPESGVDLNGILFVGGIDMLLRFTSFEMEDDDKDLTERIHHGVDGWHTEWESWGYCSKSCGNASIQYRYRRCTNPSPKFSGLECPTNTLIETRPCVKPSCDTDDGILREVWMNKHPPEFSLSNVFDGYASHLEVVPSFALSYNDGPFAERLRTFLNARETGTFKFWLSCTYQCQLWISPNDEANEKVKIIYYNGSSTAEASISTLMGSYDFAYGKNYYIEVTSFEIKGARNHTLLTIEAPSATVAGYSLVRHKPDCYHALGLESGAVPDADIHGSKYKDENQFSYTGRLNSPYPHCYRTNFDQYFHVHFQELHWIAAVVVQGLHRDGLWSAVSRFEIATRFDFSESGITQYDFQFLEYFGNDYMSPIKIVNLTEPIRSKNVVIRIASFYGEGCLQLDIIGCHAVNIARGKVADKTKAIDGSYSRIGPRYCANMYPVDDFASWLIDFGKPYYVGEIFIVGRKDCCQERMQNLEVWIGNSNLDRGRLNPQCGETFSMTNVPSFSVYCEPYGYGQYLTISKNDGQQLSLCEVAIFQIENDTLYTNWSDCSVTCGHGFEQRRTICIKPYYCKSVEEVRPCFAGAECEIFMQNCGQLHALGETETGVYKIRPNPDIQNDIYIYCDHDTDDGGWLVLQRRSTTGALNMTKPWSFYQDGFGNVSTEFWIGNKYLSQLTNHTAYEVMFLFKHTNGSVWRNTKCDAFNVSSEEENYRLQIGTCQGPDAEILKYSNRREFSTWDKDNGFTSLNCDIEITGWWFGSCNSYLNSQTLSCFGKASCDYDVTMMIKPNKVDGGWTNWTPWATCDKPCGGGNSSRVRFCTYPPPTGGGADCEGIWNNTKGCNTYPCLVIEVNVTMRFTEETWNADLISSSSVLFGELVQKIINNIKALYNADPSVNVAVNSLREGSVIADVSIIYEALDDQQLIVLQEDLDQDGLLNQDMPVVYTESELVVSEVLFGPPQITEFGNTSSTSIYIMWQPPNSTILYKLLGYRVYYKESNDTSLTMLVQAVEKNILELEITDLKYYTNYSVRVCAFSSAGNGVPSSAYHMITDEHVPTAAPKIISAHNLSSTSLNIPWLPVDLLQFNGVPNGYMLHYRIRTSDNSTAFLNITIDDYLATSINISDLMKYTEYEIYMTATTIKGEGKRGEFVHFRTDEDVPSEAPSNITLQNRTSTSLNISWTAVPQEFVHGVLREYVIQYWPVDNINASTNTTVGPEKTEVQLANLMKFTNYSIMFAGMTAKGVGNWSEIMLQTDEDIPDHGPMNLTGLNISTTAANLSWNLIPKKYRNGIIIGYRVHYDDYMGHSGSILLPASQRHLTLDGLLSYTLYNISVAGLTIKGEGWNRTFVFIRTNGGAPMREPWELVCSDVSSYTVSLNWYRFSPDLTGSRLTGYFISYRAIEPPHPTVYNVTLKAFKFNYVADNLKAYTNYSFELHVFNSWGKSNTSTVVCKTDEGKPLAPPSNIVAISKVAPDKVILKWDTVPDLLMAGIRRGYTVTYKITKEVGELIEDEPKRIDIFDPEQTEILIENLEYHCQYSFAIRVFNTKFFGDDSEPVFGETCNCLEEFYMNWCSYMPYVNTSESGIFPPLIRNAIYGICGNCSEFGGPKIYFHTQGSSLKKHGLVHVKDSINEKHQVNFPLIGRKDSKTFVPIIDSPGSVFVTKKPIFTMTVEYMFFDTIIGTLPLLGFAVVTALLAGFVMWCLESSRNSEVFPKSFSRGAPDGFWWAFISMTTVGYGDRVATTVSGKIFSIIWTLYGLVITGLLVGNLTSALTASVAFSLNEVQLYQAKIAAIENSSEFKLGLSKGAIVNKGRNYSDILTVLYAVEVGIVEGALLDMYVVSSRPELQRRDSPLMVKTIIQNPSAYGVELSGHATKLRNPFLHYLHNNAALVSSILEKYTTPVKESEGNIDSSGGPEPNDINVLAPDSPIIKLPLLYSLIALGVAVVFGVLAHFSLCRRRRKTFLKSNAAVSPVTNSAELRSAMEENVSEFCKSSREILTDIKNRHQKALKRFFKRHKS